MKCFNCNKFIPDVSEVCPYCNNSVDSNKENVIDFGNIDNTSYNSGKFDIKVYIKEPKNRKVVFGALALIVLVIIIFISLVASMFFKSSEPDYKVFTRVVAGISEYLEENYMDTEMGLGKAAEQFHVNASYLSRLFKQQSVVNFSEYFFELRMKKALEKLEHADGDMMVYHLAEMVGFADPDDFGRCFRKYTGMSFSQYKRQVRR